MILHSMDVAGFGRLVDRRFDFSAGLNVVYGLNESGKSTLANAIVATLYGVERKKEAWRPWNGAPYTTRLRYMLANGEQIEVQRDFDRDGKGLRIYDRNGNDLSARLAGHKLVPGEAHLGVPVDVFLNVACVKQQAIAIDEGKDAAPIAAHLARALDGGPREDAALGAIARLDEALRTHVGSGRARKNAPLRTLRELAQTQRAMVDEVRARRAALDDVRDRMERAAHERDRLSAACGELDRRLRSLRAGALIKQLDNLSAFRDELAALQAARAAYEDVAGFAVPESELDEAFFAWETAQHSAVTAQDDAQRARLSDAECDELECRRADVGSVDDATFEALAVLHGRANLAHTRASAAALAAAEARVSGDGRAGLHALIVAAALAACVAIGFAIAHSWTWTGVAAAVALGALSSALSRQRERTARDWSAKAKQRLADAALSSELAAKNDMGAILDPLGMCTFEELKAGRVRLTDLLARRRTADAADDRAQRAQSIAAAAAARFDRLANVSVPQAGGNRAERKAAAKVCAARKHEREGIDSHLHALEMRKSTILGSDDEYALEAELLELQHAGVDAYDEAAPGAQRVLQGERAIAGEQLRAASEAVSRLAGELTSTHAQVADLAGLDEAYARTSVQIARVEAFERAVQLAKSTLEMRTQEAHAAFARRLEDYAADTLGAITAGRYAEIFVDPATLSIRVRIPETGAIADLEAISAGTRDQTYLVVRFAMARMFAEGIETPPLLLDDPFAYWDTARIERCLPIIERTARSTQTVLFTASRRLAAAAERGGAHRVDLPEPALI